MCNSVVALVSMSLLALQLFLFVIPGLHFGILESRIRPS